jgi:hypothetical protein
MPAKRDAATELAEKMIQVLQAQRDLGPDSYPLPLRRLAELTDPAADDKLILKAAGKKELFIKQVLLAQPKNLDAPLALVEDVDRLAASPLLLEFVLSSVCTPDNPTLDVSKLKTKGKLPAQLKGPFEAAARRHIEASTLPPSVGVVTVQTGRKSQTHLHWRRYPLPVPPDARLADDLVNVLRAQRQLGGESYPLTLGRLVELTRPGADTALLKKALARREFQDAVVLALPTPKAPLQSPAALAEDADRLAASPLLLETLVRAARTDTNHVCASADLKKKIAPPLQRAFAENVARLVETRSLPPAVGCLLQKGKPLLFLTADVGTTPPPPHLEAARSATDFASAFDDAFRRLEQRQRTPNWASLVDLRRELPFDRAAFDAGLHELRRAGRYSLSGADGRHGLGEEERQAGINEGGTLLLYVSRRLS